jgi:hypothetical protein
VSRLVGSEMCIRDRKEANALQQSIQTTATHLQTVVQALGQ